MQGMMDLPASEWAVFATQLVTKVAELVHDPEKQHLVAEVAAKHQLGHFSSPREVLLAVRQAAGVAPLRQALTTLVPEQAAQHPALNNQQVQQPSPARLEVPRVTPQELKYCFCGTDRHLHTNNLSFSGTWIQCESCNTWCHGECAGVNTQARVHAALAH